MKVKPITSYNINYNYKLYINLYLDISYLAPHKINEISKLKENNKVG